MSGGGGNELQWIFDLVDKVSKPAAGMADKVGMAEKAMIASAAATAKLVQQLEHVGPAAHGAAEGHDSFLHKLHDIVEIAYEAPKIIGELWEKAKEFAHEALGEMRFKQDSVLALEAMRGTRHEAIEIFEGVEQFAWQTGQGVKEVMRTTKDLLSSGFDPEDVDALRLFLADMRVVDPGKADQVASIIGEIGRRGELTARQMIGLSNAGIDMKMMWQELSRQTGYSVAALKSMEGMSVKAGTAVRAIFQVGTTKYSKGVVGSLAEKEAQTLPALIEKVRAIPERIMAELAGFDRGSGSGVLEHVLGNIADVFDPQSASGQRIVAGIRGLFDAIGQAIGIGSGPGGLFAELAGPNGAKKVEEIVTKLIGWFRDGVPVMRDFASALKSIADSIITVGKVLNGSMGDRIYEMLHPGDVLNGPEAVRLARNTLADPKASEASRGIAQRVLSRAGITVNVVVQGNASKADAEHIGRTSAEALGNALEQHAIQEGGY